MIVMIMMAGVVNNEMKLNIMLITTNHHEIYNDKDGNDDNSDHNDQIMNAGITLHICREDF